MTKMILLIVVKMFMAFVDCTMPEEDVEQYYIAESEVEAIGDMDYEELVNYEYYYDEDETNGFGFMSIVTEDGNEYYCLTLGVEDEFSFVLVTDENYKVIGYTCERYDYEE